jgi:hypothetical protein
LLIAVSYLLSQPAGVSCRSLFLETIFLMFTS